jgi:hypothetical protein
MVPPFGTGMKFRILALEVTVTLKDVPALGADPEPAGLTTTWLI